MPCRANEHHLFVRGVRKSLAGPQALATVQREGCGSRPSVDDRIVRDRYHRVVPGAEARAAEADVLDRRLDTADLDAVADAERLLEHDQHRAEQVGQAVASGKRNGEAADAQPRQHSNRPGIAGFVSGLHHDAPARTQGRRSARPAG